MLWIDLLHIKARMDLFPVSSSPPCFPFVSFSFVSAACAVHTIPGVGFFFLFLTIVVDDNSGGNSQRSQSKRDYPLFIFIVKSLTPLRTPAKPVRSLIGFVGNFFCFGGRYILRVLCLLSVTAGKFPGFSPALLLSGVSVSVGCWLASLPPLLSVSCLLSFGLGWPRQ